MAVDALLFNSYIKNIVFQNKTSHSEVFILKEKFMKRYVIAVGSDNQGNAIRMASLQPDFVITENDKITLAWSEQVIVSMQALIAKINVPQTGFSLVLRNGKDMTTLVCSEATLAAGVIILGDYDKDNPLTKTLENLGFIGGGADAESSQDTAKTTSQPGSQDFQDPFGASMWGPQSQLQRTNAGITNATSDDVVEDKTDKNSAPAPQ